MQRLTQALDFQSHALVLRAERQRLIASNIANADTPGYVARDIDFARALREASGAGPQASSGLSNGAAPSLGGAMSARTAPSAGAMPTSTASSAGAMSARTATIAGAMSISTRTAFSASAMSVAQPAHMALGGGARDEPELLYASHAQDSLDRNTVDLDRERHSFADNAVKYEATLRFINGSVRSMLDAMKSPNQG